MRRRRRGFAPVACRPGECRPDDDRLRAALLATFPAALTIAGDDRGNPAILELLALSEARTSWQRRMGELLPGARRLADNRYLGTALRQWAFCSLLRST